MSVAGTASKRVRAREKKSFLELFAALKSARMAALLFLGFSSGLPIMLVAFNLKVWLRREGIDLGTIGYITWVTLPYSINFLWAPLLDRFVPFRLGRRRSWILIAQAGLIASLAGMGFAQPEVSLELVVGLGIAVAFFSATQDIGIDAYRREILNDEEQGIGASIVVYGYRVGMLVAQGFGLWLVDPETVGLSFHQMYFLMAAIMLVGVVTALACSEPKVEFPPPASFKQAVIDPFVEFLKRPGAWYVLLFVWLFKIGDAFAGSMMAAYYVDVGFSDAQIAEAAKAVGFFSTMIGLFLGGVLIYRLGVLRALFLFAFLQALSTALFSLLQSIGPNWWALAGVVAFEDVSSGMGTAALVAFMALLTNKRYTATQYALLSSLASLGRTFISGFAGEVAKAMGYAPFYVLGCLMAVPGILLLVKLRSAYEDSIVGGPRAGEGGGI